MEARRIDGYTDRRFSPQVLRQHGGFLVDGVPCEVEIVGPETAIIRGQPRCYGAVIEAFRFYAEHIARFIDADGNPVAAFAPVGRFDVPIDALQPSQFCVDREKLAAVETFVHSPEDVVIPLVPYGDRYVSLDGHTRLAAALALGFTHVRGFATAADDWLWPFVREAERRGIRTPRDMELLDHGEYDIVWNRYCDAVFASGAE